MSWERGTLAQFLGDAIVYRNLEPLDARLAGLQASWQRLGLTSSAIPRKTDLEYATALADFLQQAQRARGVTTPLRQLLFVGDTAMLDGTAARNVGHYWPMRGFIGAERAQQPAQIQFEGELMLANRWGALGDFLAWVRREGVPCDESTALLLDLDKTLVGARGRNDKAIDTARVEAVYGTMRATLGARFDEGAFRAVYDALNQPAYHPFTADNQDYLAYVCLMVVGGICPEAELWADLKAGTLQRIEQFVERCEERRVAMPIALSQAHDEVRTGLAQHDPTPFKAFRRREYRETVARMDWLPDETPVADVLTREIVITNEVASLATWMARQGALVFALSDKPDEASLPTPELAGEGCQPIHRTVMKLYGQAVV